jgi:hypothetical protein
MQTHFPEHLLGYLMKQLQWAHPEVEVRTDYSGRGMYGERCIGFVTDRPHALMLNIGKWVGSLDGPDGLPLELVEALMDPRLDNMGLDSIVYFPSLEGETTEEREDGECWMEEQRNGNLHGRNVL